MRGKSMKIGIVREGKIPSDNRVPLTPEQCLRVQELTSHEVIIQPSPIRCFADSEYSSLGLRLEEDMSQCDVLLGVKEVPIEELIARRTYFFFSHTIKKQAHNRKLLQAILAKNIRLIDYETITDEKGQRLIAFGRFAGMVGAHNGVMAFGSRTGLFALDRMTSFKNYTAAKEAYKAISWPEMRIVLTGTGRVGNGAADVLRDMGIKEMSPGEIVRVGSGHGAVFTQLSSSDYIKHPKNDTFDKTAFYANPSKFEANFEPYYRAADIMINGIYWDSRAPKFFSLEDMASPEFRIQVIADVTCDIAPNASIPSTIRASTIAEPVFGFDPLTGYEEDPYQPDCIDVMSIDNLPNEMPRDASRAFGAMFIEHVLPALIDDDKDELIKRAAITDEMGNLTENFAYLDSYVSSVLG